MQKRTFPAYYILLIIAIIAFAIIGFILFTYFRKGQQEESAFVSLREEIAEAQSVTISDEVPSVRFLLAYEKNPDYVGWLRVFDTPIDYPVMMTPDDPQYYLHRSFDTTQSNAGTLFVGAGCTPESNSFIIYGHNMRNGSMFGSLDAYKDREYRDEHPFIALETRNGTALYEIFAAVETQIPSESDVSAFRYYDCVGNRNPAEIEELVDWMMEHRLYDTGVLVEEDEQILMLSTCSYHTDEGRFMIAGKRIPALP